MKDDAKVLPPTAEDQVIEPEEVVEVDSVTVQPLDDATNPGGLVDDLVVTLEGPNAGRAEVTPDGGIVVKPGRERYAVAYRLTNELDELSAMAFVIVPPSATEEDIEEDEPTIPAPHLAELDPIVVPMNGSIRWDVADLVVVPSGKPALVLSASAANARSEALRRRVHAAVRARAGLPRRGIRHLRGHRRARTPTTPRDARPCSPCR